MIKSRFLREPLSTYGSISEINPARLGEVSEDRSAVVGRNNWCFIYEGSNNYRGAYHDENLAPLGDQWAKLIEDRQRKCDALGIRFVQLVVPNKATLMPENYPEPLAAGVTTVLKRLLDARPEANFLCPVEEMRNPEVRDHVFRRNDSHLTLAGGTLLTELLLIREGIDLGNINYIDVSCLDHTGDLGGKFLNPISEKICAPKFNTGFLDQCNIEKTHETIVEGFSGTKQSFHNPSAPIKQKVVVFGNSFFERVPSWGLNPIFASLFEYFHFVWASDLNLNILSSLKPDLIISQTCERFLTRLPV